jgi:hypothetical protein
VLIDKQNVVLKAGIKVSLEAKFTNDWVVMAINMGVYTIHALEHLPNHAGKRFGEGNA